MISSVSFIDVPLVRLISVRLNIKDDSAGELIISISVPELNINWYVSAAGESGRLRSVMEEKSIGSLMFSRLSLTVFRTCNMDI
jgi:hypothetical protein